MARSTGPIFKGLTVCQPSPIDSPKMRTSMRKMKNWHRLEIYWKKMGPKWNPGVHLTLQNSSGTSYHIVRYQLCKEEIMFIVSKPL